MFETQTNLHKNIDNYYMRGDACTVVTGSESSVFCFGFVSGECQDQGTDKNKEDNSDDTRDYAANAPSGFTFNPGHDQTTMSFGCG